MSAVPTFTSFTLTPGVADSRVFTARTQWSQVIPTISMCRSRMAGNLQHRPREDDLGHDEIDDQARHVDEGGDEWRRRARRIEPEAREDEREHRSRQRAHRH